MANQAELENIRAIISGLEEQLQREQKNGENTHSTEEELRRQYQMLENLQR